VKNNSKETTEADHDKIKYTLPSVEKQLNVCKIQGLATQGAEHSTAPKADSAPRGQRLQEELPAEGLK
jgi:hypothetical protein